MSSYGDLFRKRGVRIDLYLADNLMASAIIDRVDGSYVIGRDGTNKGWSGKLSDVEFPEERIVRLAEA